MSENPLDRVIHYFIQMLLNVSLVRVMMEQRLKMLRRAELVSVGQRCPFGLLHDMDNVNFFLFDDLLVQVPALP